MKYLLAILTLAFALQQSQAQIGINEACPGFRVGFNGSNIMDGFELQGNLFKPGLSAFFVVDYLYREDYSVNGGIGFSQKGHKSNKYGTVRINYLEIPLNIMYKMGEGSETLFTLHGGGYVALALSGYRKYYENQFLDLEPELIKEKLEFGFNTSQGADARPIDYGAQIGVGLETQYGMFAQLQGAYGFYDIIGSGSPQVNLNNLVVTVSLGFYFAY